MAEPANGGPTPPKEMSMEKRLLLAFILMGVVLFTTPYFFKQTAPPLAKKPVAAAPAQTAAPPAPQAKAAVEEEAPAAQGEAPVAMAKKEETYTITTGVYQVTFSNKGAVVRSWLLRKYQSGGKPLELVNTASPVDFPFALVLKNQKFPVDLNQALFQVRPDPSGLEISYEFSDGRVVARKTFRFDKDSYRSQVSTEVTQDGKPVPHLIAWRGGFGDAAVSNAAANTSSLRYDAAVGKVVKEPAKAAKDGPVTVSGNYPYAGIDDLYFTACFLPADNAAFDDMTLSDAVPTTLDPKPVPFVGTAVGGSGLNRFMVFVGPKETDILRQVNPRLEALIDYGWFSFFAKPLFLALHWMVDNYIHNYGWAIIVITTIINFILFPLKVSSMRSMKKMQALQPQIKAINDKYKDIGIRDPRKADQNAEVMALYKKYGVNPAGGCVPMILQIPFFIAFYKVLSVSIEMRGATWLWVNDLSTYEHLPLHILPLAMIISQFVMQKMTPTTGGDPNQQKMMMFMPLIFGFMFYNLPSGVVLYYLTSNLVGVAQQVFFNKTATVADIPQPQAGKKRDGKK
jgi:YidC/Oxa1 family membrane protein insertase